VATAACSSVLASPASSAATIAPTVGRITVEIASHAESMYGILSATNSKANSTPAAISTPLLVSAVGTSSAPANRPSRPSISTQA
jgi:hypothetical protein